jgi:hypothetical protein
MLKVKINHPNTDTNGTSLCGYVTTTLNELVSKLGKPRSEFGDKVTCYWNIEFSDKSVATIYDWKTETTPKGIYNWHIGGHSLTATEKVADLLELETKTI